MRTISCTAFTGLDESCTPTEILELHRREPRLEFGSPGVHDPLLTEKPGPDTDTGVGEARVIGPPVTVMVTAAHVAVSPTVAEPQLIELGSTDAAPERPSPLKLTVGPTPAAVDT